MSEASMRRLLGWVRHRGPDQEGVFVDGDFGVAAARLAVRGGPDGDQPVVDGGRVLVFNGELSGFGLGGDTRAFFQAADAETRLVLLQTGMAAYAAFDSATRVVELGVDDMGIKPLFRLDVEGSTWFASELKPLLAAHPAAREPDLRGLAELLHFQRPRTTLPFRGPRRLRSLELVPAAAHAGSDFVVSHEHAAVGADDVVGGVRRAVETSARDAAAVDGPVSLFLSGGLDSAAVAGLCARDDVLCLTGRFAPHGGPLDESDLAAEVAEHCGLPHEIVDLRDEDLLLDLPDVIAALEIPMMGPGSLATWRMAKRAREHGKVVLSGTGGDELFGGYARTALALGRAGAWTKGYEPLRAKIEAAGDDPGARLRAAFSRFADLEPCLDQTFLRSLPDPAMPEVGDDESLFDALMAEERHGTLRGLLAVEDRVTSAHGLEARPVLSLGIVPLVAQDIPPERVIGPDGEGKRVLREALRGVIPERVRTNKQKRGFPTPFARAARGAGREVAMDLLHDRRFVERGWWNVDACRALMDEERPLHDRALWAVLSWETWARLFLDGDLFRDGNPTA